VLTAPPNVATLTLSGAPSASYVRRGPSCVYTGTCIHVCAELEDRSPDKSQYLSYSMYVLRICYVGDVDSFECMYSIREAPSRVVLDRPRTKIHYVTRRRVPHFIRRRTASIVRRLRSSLVQTTSSRTTGADNVFRRSRLCAKQQSLRTDRGH